MEVLNRTRNDRIQLVVGMQMHLVVHSMNQLHNYIDLVVDQLMVVLANLVVDQNPNRHIDIEPNWNLLHQIVVGFVVDLQLDSLDYLMDLTRVFVLDHRYYLVEDRLAKQHLNRMLMKDHMNRMNEDLLNRERTHINGKIIDD
jgi:hypothetical protein